MKFLYTAFVDCCWSLRQRFIERPTVLKIRHKDMSPWKYTDRDKRLLYFNFQLFMDFLTYEEGLFTRTSFYERVSDWPILRFFIPTPANLTAGINYLITNMEDPNLEDHHRKDAKEMFDLYFWWHHARPSREDPYDFECVNRPSGIDFFRDREKYPEYEKALDRAGKLDDAYEKEDTDMLIRLIKIRGGLWT